MVLSSNYVRVKSSDIVFLRDHFITNLLEEHREKFSMKLTDNLEQSIDLKINAFLNEIKKPPVRRKRDATNDLLLNEKRKFFIQNYFTFLSHCGIEFRESSQ